MSVEAIRAALDSQKINDLTVEFRQVLADLGMENANTVDLGAVDLRPEVLSAGEPHYRLSLFASGETGLGYVKATLLVGDDWGGAVDVVVNAAGNTRVNVGVPFLPDELDPREVVALVRRAVERGTWLHHRMVAKEKELGLRD